MKLGIPEGAEDMFEVAFDENGNPLIRLKDGVKTLTIGEWLLIFSNFEQEMKIFALFKVILLMKWLLIQPLVNKC